MRGCIARVLGCAGLALAACGGTRTSADSGSGAPDPVSQDARDIEVFADVVPDAFAEPTDALELPETTQDTGWADPREDRADDEGGVSDPGPRPVWPAQDLKPLAVSSWLATMVANPASDPVSDALDRGDFEPPQAPGKDAYGLSWFDVTPGANGSLGFTGFGMFYAVARVEADAPLRVVVRADSIARVFAGAGRTPQPGDYYGSHRIRVPIALRAGGDFLVVQTWGGAWPEFEAWTSDAELFLNIADATVPDLVVADDRESWIGVPVVNLTGDPVLGVVASVIEDEHVQAASGTLPALAPLAVTQVPFPVRVKAAPAAAGEQWPIRVRVESASLQYAYEATIPLQTVSGTAAYRQTRRSKIDGSVQYHAVLRPAPFDPGATYGLVLSLHGAGVEAIGQASAYSAKDFAYIVAPTNRRPFGFDWEEWGRLDAIEALDDAMQSLRADPARTYLTGHSMGGHGTWQLGVLYPGRFRVIGPSAGWISFYTYTGAAKPTGAIGRARASSDTLAYVSNLARRAVYILHGEKDDNVPLSEAQTMYEALQGVTNDLQFHVEPGAGHWWDGDAAAGVDCVDWPSLFETMQSRVLDPFEMDFTFTTPSPRVNAQHSFVTVASEADPMADCTVSSFRDAEVVVLNTINVRRLELRGDVLRARGVSRAVIDGVEVEVPDGPLAVGPEGGKTPDLHGPFNQVFERSFCFVVPDSVSTRAAEYAAFLVSAWNVLGNGSACLVPRSAVDQALRTSRNLVYVGLPSSQVPLPPEFPVSWDPERIVVRDQTFEQAALAVVFPDQGRLAAALFATAGSEALLFRHLPFTSRSGLPDWTVWSDQGLRSAGFFTPDWR